MNNEPMGDSEVESVTPRLTCVVGIGASAGGLKALEPLFQNLPSNTGLTFIVVQHLSPEFKSLMDEILARHTRMPVINAEDEMSIMADSVYLIPPQKNIAVDNGRLVVTDSDRDQLQRPVDVLLKSIARGFGNRAVGVILSGTGSDGSAGIKDVFEAGGMTIVQTPGSCQFDGMPVNAIATECIHTVLPPAEIAQLLVEHALDPTKRPDADDAVPQENVSGIKLVFSLLCDRYGIDFGDYKPTTVARRIERRIQASQSKSMEEFAIMLRSDATEVDLLYHDLLIGVTKFFRDSEAFHSLQAQLNRVVARLPEGSELRVWSAACATGEEPYTLAMIGIEAFERLGRAVNLKVLATDVHQGALDKAARGVYSASSMEFVSSERQAKFFTPIGKSEFRVHPELRRHIIFARHNVLQDPPFTKIHLVTCRNMLIYLEAKAQAAAIGSFHFAMEPNGMMMLGASETPGRLADEFEAIDQTWRIYRKLRSLPHLMTPGGEFTNAIERGPRRLVNILNRDKPEQLSFTGLLEAYDLLLAEFVDCGLLLDDNRNVLHVFGNAYRFLQSSTGRFTGNIMRLLEGDIRTAIGAALVRSANEFEKVFRLCNLSFPSGGDDKIDVSIRALKNKSVKGFVWFIEFTSAVAATKAEVVKVETIDSGEDYFAIQSELTFTKESLSATIEELETSNEELQATNEELIASNEELQSTNEELHSVNEELYSVNSENQRKIFEQNVLSEDVENLLRSTDIGTVFVDPDMCIRKFTRAATKYFNLVEHDVGRPLPNFTHSLQCDNLIGLLQKVMDTETVFVTELKDKTGADIILKILPYKSATSRSGAILNIVNVAMFTQTDMYEDDDEDD